jgi:predicted DNA-binding transcriptional regulator AlpA
MEDEAVVTYDGLSKEYGIQISRTHIARLEKAEKFPKRFKPFETRGSRFYYRRREIRAWLASQLT